MSMDERARAAAKQKVKLRATDLAGLTGAMHGELAYALKLVENGEMPAEEIVLTAIRAVNYKLPEYWVEMARLIDAGMPHIQWPIKNQLVDGREYATFDEFYHEECEGFLGPFDQLKTMLAGYRSGAVTREEGIKGIRDAKKKANQAAVAKVKADNPKATQEQIAEKVGLSRSRVTEIVGEMSANQTPKLRKHGGKREKQADNNKVAPKKFGTDPDYIKTRLARDKADEDQPAEVRQKAGFLLAGIERGEVKPHGAAKAMGYVKPKPYKQIPVDSAESAIQALLRVFSRDELVAALMHEERTNEAA